MIHFDTIVSVLNLAAPPAQPSPLGQAGLLFFLFFIAAAFLYATRTKRNPTAPEKHRNSGGEPPAPPPAI
jgi:hypothetical protein